MEILLILLCFSTCVLGDWINSYNNDSREFCPTDLDLKILNERVVGGNDAGLGNFPYMAGIIAGASSRGRVRTDNTICGSSLVTDRHILTAAHCLYNNQNYMDSLRMNIGDYDLTKSNEVKNYIRKVRKIDIHPRYKEQTYNNDLCIITLDKAIPLNEGIRMAILPPFENKLETGSMVTAIGWGRTDYSGSRSHILQNVDLPITSREECQSHLEHTVTENMLCAGGVEGKDACLGDSGGPLLCRAGNVYSIVGIVSFGRNCGLANVSGVYTNVSRYTDWIYEKTKSAKCKPRLLQ